MSLRRDRILFSWGVGKLMLYANELDLACALDYVKRCDGGEAAKGHDCPVGKPNSNHKRGLAVDIHIYADLDGDGDHDDYLPNTEAHKKLGDYWEALHPQFRWGGRYNDGNHYECLPRNET